jgi:hypothetical protein
MHISVVHLLQENIACRSSEILYTGLISAGGNIFFSSHRLSYHQNNIIDFI